jgi:NADH:ubiquinone oxidoreductase subunit H
MGRVLASFAQRISARRSSRSVACGCAACLLRWRERRGYASHGPGSPCHEIADCRGVRTFTIIRRAMPEFAAPLVNWFLANLPWIVMAVVMHLVVLGTVAFMILGERKVAAWAQDRVGPNRAGFGFGIIPIVKNYRFLGLGQSFADGIKMFMKEDYRSPNADRNLFTLAPMIMMAVVVISIAVIPWGGTYGRERSVSLGGAVAAGAPIQQAVERSMSGANTLQSPIAIEAKVGEEWFNCRLDERGNLVRLETGEPVDPRSASSLTAKFTEGWRFQIASLNVGVIYILAVLGLAVYGVVIGGYASNNKYSFLGGLRATANMISYEIPLGISILCIAMMYGSFDLHDIVNKQAGYWVGIIPSWNVFCHPLTFVLFLICIHAEANRAPFDTAECEQELVGGYHTEYSSMRFGMFFLAEYAGMITTSAICVALFFGGWHLPWIDYIWKDLSGVGTGHVTDSILAGIVRIAVFFTKTLGVVFIFMWVRWSVPRFRFDQIMSLAWKTLIPVSLGLLVTTAVGVYLTGGRSAIEGVTFGQALIFLVLNAIVAAATLFIGGLLKVGQANPNHRIAVPNSRYATSPAV